jgi:hypothetical protein
VKLKKTATETLNLLCEAHGEETLSIARVFEWHKRFTDGREDVEHDDGPCRPITMKIDENVEEARTLCENDSGGDEYGQRNGEINNKLEHEKSVPKWSQRIHPFLAGKQIPTSKYALYLSDTPCDSFLFPKLKRSPKGTHFRPTEDIHKETDDLLKALSQNDFRRCFEAWKARLGDLHLPMEITLKWITCGYNNSVNKLLF